MKIDERPDGVLVVGWRGPVFLNAVYANELGECVRGMSPERSRLVFGMRNVDFVGGPIVEALAGFMRAARGNGDDARPAGLNPNVRPASS